MVDQITVPTYDQIETILTKLATNYSNLAILFYDIFYNTEPKEVTFQMYNEEGVLETYTIPNRAKDMRNILSGNGSPQGSIIASKGVLYQDLTNGDLYIKETPYGDTGWARLITKEELDSIFLNGIGIPEGVVIADKGTLYVDKTNAALYIKTTLTGSMGWNLISADTENLANRDLSNLTSTGENFFTKKDLSNITSAGQAKFDAKEDTSNKVTSLSASSTDTQFPSAKAVYDFIGVSVAGFADKDFSNITNTAKSKFLGNDVLHGCVISANELLQKDGIQVTLSSGTTILTTSGLNATNKPNNTLVTINDNIKTILINGPGRENLNGKIFYDSTYSILRCPLGDSYIVAEEAPELPDNSVIHLVWYKPSELTYHCAREVEDNVQWVVASMAEIGEYSTDSNGDIPDANFHPYHPVILVLKTDLDNAVAHTVVETGGTEDNWYRLYRDGWIEAGGYIVGSGTINFNKEFKTTNYTFVPSNNATFTKSVDSVTISVSDSSTEVNWLASGWGA